MEKDEIKDCIDGATKSALMSEWILALIPKFVCFGHE